jgi:hypothetical protein
VTLVTPRLLASALSLLLLASPAAAKREPFDYGPPPDWEEYKRLGEAAVRAALPDQASWAIEWPNGYTPYEWDNKGYFPGYMTCGIMRAIAPVTKRYPVTNFIVVIDRGVVRKVDIAKRATNDIRNQVCRDEVARGLLPPARMMKTAHVAFPSTQPAPSDELPIRALGLTIRPMAEGAYIMRVEPGSAGQRAGLTAGTVITSVNAIPLAGMGAAMASLLGSDAPSLVLESVAGQRIVVTRAAP